MNVKMDVKDRFVTEFEKASEERMDIVEFLNQYFQHCDKKKYLPVKLTVNNDELIADLKIRIFENLYNNPYFKEGMSYNVSKAIVLQPFYRIMKECRNTENFIKKENEDLDTIARLIFLLHFSKANLEGTLFVTFFRLFDTIKMTTCIGSLHGFDIVDFSNRLLLNRNIKIIVKQTIQKITNEEYEYDSETKILFFTASITGLNGFAGNKTIYISYTSLIDFFYNVTRENLIVFKINLVRLVLHELCHDALQSLFSNLNFSTPNFKETISKNYPVGRTYLEAGLLAEINLFSCRVDWATANLNVTYCEKFLDNFIQGDFFVFEPKEANANIIDSPCYEMAIDFLPPKKIDLM